MTSLNITDENYPKLLDRFDVLWSMTNLSSELEEEIQILADLISSFEERRFPIFNNPTYRELLDERLKR